MCGDLASRLAWSQFEGSRLRISVVALSGSLYVCAGRYASTDVDVCFRDAGC